MWPQQQAVKAAASSDVFLVASANAVLYEAPALRWHVLPSFAGCSLAEARLVSIAAAVASASGLGFATSDHEAASSAAV